MKTVVLIWILLVIFPNCQAEQFADLEEQYEHAICITSSLDEGSDHCTNCNSDRYVFECILNSIENSTVIYIRVAELELTALFKFSGLNNIAFIGSEKQSRIHCITERMNDTGAGLAFIAVENLVLSDLVFEHCGALHESTTTNITSKSTLNFRASIYILNSTSVVIQNVTVRQSNGNGIAFFDTDGTVTVTNSLFEENMVPESQVDPYSGGGCVYVEFTKCSPGIYGECDSSTQYNKNSRYVFSECKFVSNNATSLNPSASTSYVYSVGTNFQGLGRGGGLCIFFQGRAFNNSVNISDCDFQNNSAVWGGGVYVAFHDSPKHNVIVIRRSYFMNNVAYKNAGGGAHVGYFFHKDGPQQNKIDFQNCNFVNNTAKLGGGVGIFSSKANFSVDLKNEIVFMGCLWTGNRARYGAAVDISPHVWDMVGHGSLPVPVFEDSEFTENKATHEFDYTNSSIQYRTGRGAFLVTGFTVQFRGELYFANNNGSAMHITSGVLEFESGVDATFEKNDGFEGGAITLIGMSAMQVKDNSTFTFTDNTAVRHGGAMFVFSTNRHDYVSSRSCFIQYIGDTDLGERGITLDFTGNRAGPIDTKPFNNVSYNYGHSIMVNTLQPCHYACSVNQNRRLTVNNTLDCITEERQFQDQSGESRTYEITTEGHKFKLNENCTFPLKVIPGKEFKLPVDLEDDFHHEVYALYHVSIPVSIQRHESSVKIDEAYSYTFHKQMKIYGKPNDIARLLVFKSGFREMAISFEVELDECPPGFVLHGSNQRCICSADSDFPYKGVIKCKNSLIQAYIQQGYWIGYDINETESGLLSGCCPHSFCKKNDKQILLPPLASKQKLDELICGTTRTGILCGKCSEGYSAYFHSWSLSCGENKRCEVGLLFYALAELLPLTLLFLTVIIFNVSFTSGATNGFIFFAQILDFLSVTVTENGFIWLPDAFDSLKKVALLIYRILNFDFFSLDSLSFCIWKGATTLDVLTFKYVSVVYAIALVAITILCMNICNCYRVCPCLRVRTVKSSVIHGLSAFLVMCYAQCVRVTLYILCPVDLFAQSHQKARTVVYKYGEIEFFSKDHLPYAILAILFLIIIVLIPPLLLLVYPVYYKIIALLRLDDSKKLLQLSRWIPIEKLKPLLDSFQSCFKDNFRFFAGLYFLYRLFALGAYSFAIGFTEFYIIVEIELIVMLMLHAMAQPYQRRWHNIVDSFIFTDLAVINGLFLYNHIRAVYGYKTQIIVEIILVVLIYLPMVYMTGYVVTRLILKIKSSAWCNNNTMETSTEEFEFPARLLRNDSSSSESGEDDSVEYHQFEDHEL